MRRIILLVLLFIVVLVLALFLSVNWGNTFQLQLGFSSGGVEIPVIIWTLCSFGAGILCSVIIAVTGALRKAKKSKKALEKKNKDTKAEPQVETH